MTRRHDIVEANGRSFDLLTSGRVLLRLSLPDNKRLFRSDIFVKQVGGVKLSVTVRAALLGLRTNVISKPPAHDIGSFVKGEIRSFGISDGSFMYGQSSVARVDTCYYENGAYPGRPKVIYDRGHSPSFFLDTGKIPEGVYTVSKCFHTIGIILALNGDIHETTVEMIRGFKTVGILVSFDVNFRGDLWTGDQARGCALRIPPYVDIFFCFGNIIRPTFLKTGTAREMMENFTERFPISIAVSTQKIVHNPKRHTFGFVIYDAAKDEYCEEEPYWDIEVVDRIGGDDAYISGVLYRLPSMGGDRVKAAAFGDATAAAKNTIPRDLLLSNLEEIQTIIRTHNQAGPQSEMVR